VTGYSTTRISNLIRDDATGIYYAICKVKSGERWLPKMRSLKTKSFEAAKLLLPKKLAAIRSVAGVALNASVTLGECAAVYLERLEKRADLKASAIKYRRETFVGIRKTWAGFDETPAIGVNQTRLESWWLAAVGAYWPARANGMHQTLAGVLSIAVEAGALEKNLLLKASRPASLKPASVPSKHRELPPDDNVAALMVALQSRPDREGAYLFCRILELTGYRPKSVRDLKVGHVDIAKGLIHWPPIKHNKTTNDVPMLPELLPLMSKLVGRRNPEAFLLAIDDPRRALRSGCKEVKIASFSPGWFRHLWTTRMIEAGVPIPLIAAMRGDKDGGAMLSRTYSHPRVEAMREALDNLPKVDSKIVGMR